MGASHKTDRVSVRIGSRLVLHLSTLALLDQSRYFRSTSYLRRYSRGNNPQYRFKIFYLIEKPCSCVKLNLTL